MVIPEDDEQEELSPCRKKSELLCDTTSTPSNLICSILLNSNNII